jgi:hypothetical protein
VLVVDMQPHKLAQHLAEQQQQRQMQQLSGNGELEVSPATHLERWTNATLSSIKVGAVGRCLSHRKQQYGKY